MKLLDTKKVWFLDKDFKLANVDNYPIENKKYKKAFIEINNEIYKIKKRNINILYNELLGEKISEYFKLKTVKSILTTFSNINVKLDKLNLFLLTKSFIDTNKLYFNINKLDLLDYFNCFEMVDSLKGYYNKELHMFLFIDELDLDNIKIDLKKMIIRDYITNQGDRNRNNFLYEYNDNHVKMMPLYDYEHSFMYRKYTNKFEFDPLDKDIRNHIHNDLFIQELLIKALDLNINNIFDIILEEYHILLNNLEKENYNKIIDNQKKEILEYKLVK